MNNRQKKALIKRSLNALVSGLDQRETKAVREKFKNLSGKTGMYNVPEELWQKRTARNTRVLISWRTVMNNGLTLEQLESGFEGHVVVELVNNDYFDKDNHKIPLFAELVKRLGSDSAVCAIISIRNQSGKSDSKEAADAFESLQKNFPSWESELVRRKPGLRRGSINKGNEKLQGKFFVKVAGGSQNPISSHKKLKEPLFNPACEYANSEVCLDIEMVMMYFALHAQPRPDLTRKQQLELQDCRTELAKELKNIEYQQTNLLEYCHNHLSMHPTGKLIDVVQVEEIAVTDFASNERSAKETLDFTHNEPVESDRFYWDDERKVVLSPARPNNVFWSKHLSNMMQQNMGLTQFLDYLESLVLKHKDFKK